MSMSSLPEDVSFNFTFPTPCDPTTPPSFSFDPSLLDLPYNPGHARSSSHGSAYSFESSPSDSAATISTRRTTPARSPIRTHGPLLLPKIRSQDQAFGGALAATAQAPAPKRMRTSPSPAPPARRASSAPSWRPSHQRSHTNPETTSFSSSLFATEDNQSNIMCSPVSFAPAPILEETSTHMRRASSCDVSDNMFPNFRQMPSYMATSDGHLAAPSSQPQQHLSQPDAFLYQPYAPRASSPLAAAAPITSEPAPTKTLLTYLTASNPAPSLVRSIAFALRDPNTKHFWWDVRQIRPWTGFTASTLLSLPSAAGLLSCPVPASLLPTPSPSDRHPETEAALHSIYASYYLPKLNNALALSSQRPLQLALPSKAIMAPGAGHSGMATDCMFVANIAGEASSAAAIFGGKPTARVVGLVKSFDRFNTGMRVEGNVKRVEYLRGLAHLHHAMREHGCRYGFILTEIELVFVRNGTEATPHFGYLEVGSVQLAATSDAETAGADNAEAVPLTACLALWGLCMLAGDEAMPGQAHWRAEIGAPAEGTRRKVLPRDDWMPQPQLAEKREAKRARGWVLPEDAVGRKELGKRGVRYGAC